MYLQDLLEQESRELLAKEQKEKEHITSLMGNGGMDTMLMNALSSTTSMDGCPMMNFSELLTDTPTESKLKEALELSCQEKFI